MKPTGTILVVDDDGSLRAMLAALLIDEGHAVVEAADGRTALEQAGGQAFDLALVDLRLPDTTGLELLPRLKELRPEASVIVLTALGSVRDAVEAMRLGADNFVAKPVDPPALFTIVEKGLEAAILRRRMARVDRLAAAPGAALLGDSPELREVVRLAESVAGRDTTVLLTGPTGSGKGRLARWIHAISPRGREPFVELNCAGLSRELTESELFGHERGAFTGAVDRKLGLFEAAEGGTLLLDEVGELDPAVQAKLLKVLEDKRCRRVGGVAEQRVDVRLVAATHRDLGAEVAAGRFRQDLFYRLAVFTIALPPLADRPEDILPLALHFLGQFRAIADPAQAVSEEAAAILLEYPWPGNARELRNVMERAAIVAPEGSVILPRHLPPLHPAPPSASAGTSPAGAPPAGAPAPPATMEESERAFLEQALKNRKGSLRAAARDLGIARATLYRKARKYGIPLDEPRSGS